MAVIIRVFALTRHLSGIQTHGRDGESRPESWIAPKIACFAIPPSCPSTEKRPGTRFGESRSSLYQNIQLILYGRKQHQYDAGQYRKHRIRQPEICLNGTCRNHVAKRKENLSACKHHEVDQTNQHNQLTRLP